MRFSWHGVSGIFYFDVLLFRRLRPWSSDINGSRFSVARSVEASPLSAGLRGKCVGVCGWRCGVCGGGCVRGMLGKGVLG